VRPSFRGESGCNQWDEGATLLLPEGNFNWKEAVGRPDGRGGKKKWSVRGKYAKGGKGSRVKVGVRTCEGTESGSHLKKVPRLTRVIPEDFVV